MTSATTPPRASALTRRSTARVQAPLGQGLRRVRQGRPSRPTWEKDRGIVVAASCFIDYATPREESRRGGPTPRAREIRKLVQSLATRVTFPAAETSPISSGSYNRRAGARRGGGDHRAPSPVPASSFSRNGAAENSTRSNITPLLCRRKRPSTRIREHAPHRQDQSSNKRRPGIFLRENCSPR